MCCKEYAPAVVPCLMTRGPLSSRGRWLAAHADAAMTRFLGKCFKDTVHAWVHVGWFDASYDLEQSLSRIFVVDSELAEVRVGQGAEGALVHLLLLEERDKSFKACSTEAVVHRCRRRRRGCQHLRQNREKEEHLIIPRMDLRLRVRLRIILISGI